MKYLKILSILFVFCFLFTLCACNYENQSNAPPENEIENPTNEDKNEGNKMNIKISNTIFEVVLENNTTTTAFVEMLPLSLEMSELNGNEKYCYLNSSLPTSRFVYD